MNRSTCKAVALALLRFPDRVTDSTEHIDTDDTSSVFDAAREQVLQSALWKWLPGMAWVHPDGRRGRVEVGVPPIPGALPELLDAGTRGCLLDLIRYQYNEPRLSLVCDMHNLHWYVGFTGFGCVRFQSAYSEVDAIVNAFATPAYPSVFQAL